MKRKFKKLAATIALMTTLFAGVQIGGENRAHAFLAAFVSGNVILMGATFIGMGMGFMALDEGRLPWWLVPIAASGFLFEDNATAVQVLPKDIEEQVSLGVYTEAEGQTISNELTILEAQPELALKIAIEGKSSDEIRDELVRALNVSELTAAYLLARSGIQTE